MTQASVELFSVDKLEDKSFKDRLKMVMSGLSGAFTFPIATLAVLSVFLAFGGFLESLTSGKVLKMVGGFIKSLAFPILQALPLLFCVAFTASFCKNDFACVWGSVISYLVFLSVQSVFIWPEGDTGEISSVSSVRTIDNVRVPGYVVLFPVLGRDKKVMLNLVDRTLGFTALNTSVFGALLLGGVLIPYIQRNFSNVNLPGPFAFFSGKRFIPVLSSLAGTWLAMMFLTFWPWVGQGLSFLGKQIQKTPYGIDSFLFGFIEKSLIPFGLHHAFYAPLWYSSLGGDVIASINEKVSCGSQDSLTLSSSASSASSGTTSCSSDSTTITTAKAIYEHITRPTSAAGYLWNLFSGARISHAMWKGDSFIGASVISLPSNEVKVSSSSSSSSNVMKFMKDSLGINVGKFTQGKYPVMQFGLPCAGLAMLYASPKENRDEASKVIFPGILSSLLMGITEPLEFMFLFSAPKLFYGFHAVCCGISFALMNVLGAHMPSIFSGGLVEALLLGILPSAKGTNFHIYFVVGGLLAPLYFTVFSIVIRAFDLKTPGRNVDSSLFSSDSLSSDSKVPEQTRKLALGFGGWDNLEKMSNCASRLRYDIVDKSKVNEAVLKSAGVIAIKWVGDNHVQAIVGPKAEAINNEMLKWKGEDLGG